MCCCQLCMSTKFQFGALSSYRRNKLASMPQDEVKENYESSIAGETLKDELNKVMCQPVTLDNEKKYCKFKCMMQECTTCPTYQIHPIEFQNDEDSDKIKFQTWDKFYKCS